MKNPIRNNLIIELHVPDFEVVKNFYSKLGFEVSMNLELNKNQPGYLTMIRKDGAGNTMLNFYGGDERVYNQSYFKQFPKDTKRGYAIEITIVTSNIEEIYKEITQRLKDSIVRELDELEDHGHVWKDFRMIDPFGFYLRFTEIIDWGQQ